MARHGFLVREVDYKSMSCRCICRFGLLKSIATMDRWIQMPRLKCPRLIWIDNIRMNCFWLNVPIIPQAMMWNIDGLMTAGCIQPWTLYPRSSMIVKHAAMKQAKEIMPLPLEASPMMTWHSRKSWAWQRDSFQKQHHRHPDQRAWDWEGVSYCFPCSSLWKNWAVQWSLKNCIENCGWWDLQTLDLHLAKATWLVNTRGSTKADPAQSKPPHMAEGIKSPWCIWGMFQGSLD